MNIDFKLLADQKLELVGIAMENQSGAKELEAGFLTKEQADALDGVIGLLDAIQDKQEDNKALKNTWDFVEKYYPDYSSSDNICRALDLMLIKEDRDLTKEEDEELTYLMEDVYCQSINNFIQSQNK